VSDRTGKEASAADLWQGLKIRMDDRQASYRRSWLRAPLGEPAHQPVGKELASDLSLACRLYLWGDEVLRREIRESFEGGRPFGDACSPGRGRSPISSPTPATGAGRGLHRR
jgi:hypothetical protein